MESNSQTENLTIVTLKKSENNGLSEFSDSRFHIADEIVKLFGEFLGVKRPRQITSKYVIPKDSFVFAKLSYGRWLESKESYTQAKLLITVSFCENFLLKIPDEFLRQRPKESSSKPTVIDLTGYPDESMQELESSRRLTNTPVQGVVISASSAPIEITDGDFFFDVNGDLLPSDDSEDSDYVQSSESENSELSTEESEYDNEEETNTDLVSSLRSKKRTRETIDLTVNFNDSEGSDSEEEPLLPLFLEQKKKKLKTGKKSGMKERFNSIHEEIIETAYGNVMIERLILDLKL